jgi:hypothetical protein
LDSSKPWEARDFESLKIISAGLAMASGAALNEVITNGISSALPFLAPIAGDISAVISGLISSFLSALVLMAFDRYKDSIRISNNKKEIAHINVRLSGYSVLHGFTSTLKTEVAVAEATAFMNQQLLSMAQFNHHIEINLSANSKVQDETVSLQEEAQASIVKSESLDESTTGKLLGLMTSLDNQEE